MAKRPARGPAAQSRLKNMASLWSIIIGLRNGLLHINFLWRMGIFNSFLHTTEELISYTYMDLSNSLDGYRRDYCYRSTSDKIYEASAIYVVCKIPLRVTGFQLFKYIYGTSDIRA